MTETHTPKQPSDATAVIVFASGKIIWGKGFGKETTKVGELCFNTGLTGYQETLTDPSYASQIITFTFPHIGNTGTTDEDIECATPYALGLVTREKPTTPANWRNELDFNDWLIANNLPGIYGIDTRALTKLVRDEGAPNVVICHRQDKNFDIPALLDQAKSWPGLEGMDLAKEVSCTQPYEWSETVWDLKQGYTNPAKGAFHVVAVDYGAKRNIVRCLVAAGCKVTVVPAQTSAEDILAYNPDGVFLSNGPGDPAATAEYAVPMIKTIIDRDIPMFGICLGHQLLGMALGGKTRKMHLGHRGANQPVKDLTTGKVEITSQNHGFEIIAESLPEGVEATHQSLFDGSNEGLQLKGKPAFSVQYHPEAAPGPQDSFYLFERFVQMIAQQKAAA